VADLLGSGSALIAARKGESYEQLIGMGLLADTERADRVLRRLPRIQEAGVFHDEEAIYYGLSRFGVVALFEGDGGALTNHRIYMARLFLEEAAQAIRNAELREELLRKEKLSAVGQGVSMVAHDLRSPLGNIISLTELIEEDQGITEENRELLRLIASSAHSASNIVNDILDFARGGGLWKEETTTRKLCDIVDREARRMSENESVTLEVIDEARASLICDQSKLSRALINLIRNSAEALSRSRDTEKPKIELRCRQEGDQILFLVSDNGPGLPEVVRDNLFIPFVAGSTEGKERGTGLGLAIVKHFVDLHDGTVAVETGRDGTTFTIGIPA
jgi:signal transduction histidine kinase